MAALGKDTELGGRYRLRGRIATGGMGEVWRAEDTLLHRKVAVKVLKSELTSDPTFVERFRAEARNTAALSHPGIAAVHDYGEVMQGEERTAYLVMELVEGEPLSAILAREGRLPTARVLRIVGQAAAALEAAHKTGMVHRDVKPGNVLVAVGDSVKITDFGIARVAESVPLTQAGMVVGTAQYFAPEQAEGKATTPASDVYSLAVVAYECLAGRLPFEADSSVAVAVMQIRNAAPPLPEDVPPPVRAVIARGMAKDPKLRFATGGEFAAALQALGDAMPNDPPTVMAPPPPPVTRVLPGPMVSPSGPAGPGGPGGPGTLIGPGGPGTPRGAVPGQPSVAGPPPPMLGPPTSGGLPPVEPRRRRGPFWLLVFLMVIATVLATTAVVRALRDEDGNGRPGNQPDTTATPTASGTPTGGSLISVDLDLYRGVQVRQACRDLAEMGLRPTVEYVESAAVSEGRIIDVRPSGQQALPPGSTVLLVASGHRGRGQDCTPNKKDDD